MMAVAHNTQKKSHRGGEGPQRTQGLAGHQEGGFENEPRGTRKVFRKGWKVGVKKW